MPKVSVVLTSYNQGKYLAVSIESVLNQSFQDFELLICDDGSTDDSQQIIKSYSDARIKTFLYEKNRGSYFAVQEAIKNSTGKYFALQHSDDIWETSKLEKQVQFLDKNPQYEVCFTQTQFIDEHGEIYELPETHAYKNIFRRDNRSRAQWLNHLFWRANCFCNPSMLMRNAPENFAMEPCLFQLPDYFMWINLCLRKNLYVLPEELIKFRLRRGTQNSVSSLRLENFVRDSNENYIAAKQFLPILRDKKFFLEVFPEAEKFLIGGEISTEFAFARLCLQRNLPAFRKLALEILFDLLHNEGQKILLQKLYGYDEKSFIGDTGTFDVFNVKSKMPLVNCKLYAGLNSIEKSALIKPDDNFELIFDFRADNEIKNLRLDFGEQSAFSIEISKISVNGETVEWSEDFKIDKSFPAGQMRVEISGTIKKSAILQQKDNQIQELQKIIREQAETIEKFQNSNSWKITKPLRTLGKILRNSK